MKRITYAIFTLTFVTTMLGGQSFVHAATNYNDIIDDSVFDRSTSLNASQIDSFLNTFSNSCISTNNGFSAPDVTGYSPRTSFTYGANVSAGTVIYHASQAYGINPEVILTTLEKEQGLVRGGGPNIVRNGTDCGALAISASMGYNCPDSQVLTSYSGFTLYAHNGVAVTSVNNTCVESASYVGFSRQVVVAAWQYTFDRHRSEGWNNWYINKPNWDNTDDLNFCYSQRTIAGGPFYLCPDQNSHASDPYVQHSGQYNIDGTIVTIANGTTAALYNYTPHLHGQDLFTSIFTSWFGSTHNSTAGIRAASQSSYAGAPCSINIGQNQVGRLYQPDTQDFLYTTSGAEACSAVHYGYIWDGVVFQGVASNNPNAIPVYRLANLTNHLFTTSTSVMNTYLSNYGYHSEGTGFYVYGSNVSGSLPVTELTNGEQTFVFTDAVSEATYYQDNYGYSSFGTAFYTPNMTAQTPGSVNIVRLSKNNQRLYTTSAAEQSLAVNNYGYISEGNASLGDDYPNQNNTPIYRLRSPTGGYFYTIDRQERDLAVINYGYQSEGIGFYELRWSSASMYRLMDKSTHARLFTQNSFERSLALSRYGYVDEGAGWYSY